MPNEVEKTPFEARKEMFKAMSKWQREIDEERKNESEEAYLARLEMYEKKARDRHISSCSEEVRLAVALG